MLDCSVSHLLNVVDKSLFFRTRNALSIKIVYLVHIFKSAYYFRQWIGLFFQNLFKLVNLFVCFNSKFAAIIYKVIFFSKYRSDFFRDFIINNAIKSINYDNNVFFVLLDNFDHFFTITLNVFIFLNQIIKSNIIIHI